MKKSCTCTIIGTSGRDCILIIFFQLYGCKTSLFEGNLFWIGQYLNRNSKSSNLPNDLVNFNKIFGKNVVALND